MKRFKKLLIASVSLLSVATLFPLSACSGGAMHTITMINENEKGGTLYGEGTYKAGNQVTISYNANKNYKFEHWNIDGETIKISSKTYIFKMPNKDITVTGNFVLKQFTVTVKHDEHVTIIGEGKHDVGSLVTLEAIPAPGYKFDDWEDDSKETISRDPIYSFTMPGENITIRAYVTIDN